jgi:hypothetical protein
MEMLQRISFSCIKWVDGFVIYNRETRHPVFKWILPVLKEDPTVMGKKKKRKNIFIDP